MRLFYILTLFSDFQFRSPLEKSRGGRGHTSRGSRNETHASAETDFDVVPKSATTLADSLFLNPTRFVPGNHFPKTNLSTDSQTDETDGEQSKKLRVRCLWCNNRYRVEKKTNYICKLCKVPLCIEPCFEYYHSCD